MRPEVIQGDLSHAAALELSQIKHGAGGRGVGNPLPRSPVAVDERGAPMDLDARPMSAASPSHGDVNHLRFQLDRTEQKAGGAVRGQGPGPTGKDGARNPSEIAKLGIADGYNAAMDRVKAPPPSPTFDRHRAKASVGQLRNGGRAMLRRSERSRGRITGDPVADNGTRIDQPPG